MRKLLRIFKHYFERLGPGFITGAADDDPSGIATYSIAGAQFGYKMNWLSLFLIPLMISIQEMCGRIGMVSGMGLAGVMRRHYSKRILLFAITLLFVANTINIGADLGIMAASMKMLVGLPFFVWLIAVTLFTVFMEIFVPYDKYSRYLKWMGLSLLVYGLTAVISKQNWGEVLFYTAVPHIEFNIGYLLTLVGFLGTTISPYLFFWEASQVVEEEIKNNKIREFEEVPKVLDHEIRHMKIDTSVGMIFSNLISASIILTTASTLHQSGIFDIETPQQAALALRPLAGNFAFLLFTFGMIGIGLQSVPILAGGIAYAFAEAFGFKEGLAKKLTEAKAFYATIAIATGIGALMNLVGINAIKALYYTAIINGIIAVPLIFMIIKLADDERVVGRFKSTRNSKFFAWMTFVFMGAAVFVMLLNLFFPSAFSSMNVKLH